MHQPLLTNLATVVANGALAQDGESSAAYARFIGALTDLLDLKLDLDSVVPGTTPVVPSPLLLAQLVEQTHLMLFQHPKGDDFYGSELDYAMGALVIGLCKHCGVDLDIEGQYVMTATSDEICQHVLSRIAEALATA